MGLDGYVMRWNLTPDGAAIHTTSSDLMPVRWQGRAAMLKVARSAEEVRGHDLMVWLHGQGAARVFKREGAALLLERLEPTPALADWALAGQDDGATRVLCGAAAGVHVARGRPWPELPGLPRWFRSLEATQGQGEGFTLAWATAQRLLSEPRDVRPLHGDLHHGNVLHSPERGWLVIDPKGLIGEQTFDFANMLCNPAPDHALRPGRLERQSALIAREAGLDRTRLLAWVGAYAGLSAAWHLEDGQEEQAWQSLAISALAHSLL
ncbi:aminoglycoside phosphotransferase family protein [Deinococcus soli (ex Cha et al. 2016)]|uniref:Streptomycin 6-kinase n=2 Tax=Deinococcus soli (ex Cha et al. 2016) TaxID=1309411 RepID=A0AAE3XAG9_9DEIO|nr:aminoglycoside phosphotransferase family protein [Deinococcus soli (ex Cha et al. 2016)]MDR6216475.1 streptomycin 6-kinase [Deinococcus soli (ex Cha et al. 2016)]MDR6327296.1 streptomycin 6-kinase [Deinococcus soli (ex Cha et al. 2016)]MDR6749571.1 streptomycin 6-kinase [Deinococcus soli (ex Cha et al. 2016)]